MPEREQLVKKVFPRIRAAARERGVEFTEIDLRWGITDDETKAGKTIRICLEEIDRCAPYFLGIMGSRYGYVPGLEALDLDPELIKKYPWIREQAAAGNSITEMEFYEGAILHSAKASAFIYDQSEKLYCDGPADLEKLSALKGKIAGANVPLRDFSTPEELGEQVLSDLLAILERDWPVEVHTDELSSTRQVHEAFALNRQRSYVADPHYEELFDAFVNAENEPLVICARSGLGKSSLLAHLLRDYKHKHPEAFVVSHFIGAGSSASTAFDFMRHVMLEIKHRYSLSDEVPIDSTKILEEFPNWLARLQNEKLILGVDAVNQLTGVDKELNWLPQFIPAAVRLIITTTPEDTEERLRSRGWQMLELQPITAGTRANITRTYLERYRKVLPVALFERVTSDEKTSSPLFLRTFLEEIRIFGEHSNLKNEIERYLSSADEGELFQNVLLRMERDHGEETVRRIMTGIWASRFGLSETELLGFTGLTRVELSTLLISLEYHLMQRGGLHTFFHAFLREAVEIRYLPTEEIKLKLHYDLGEYFSKQSASIRRSDEEPYQWQKARNQDNFVRALCDPNQFAFLSKKQYELTAYWNTIREQVNPVAAYRSMLDEVSKTESEVELLRIKNLVAELFITLSLLSEAKEFLLESLGPEDAKFSSSSYIDMLRQLATIEMFSGNYQLSSNYLKEALNIFDTTPDYYFQHYIDTLISLTTSLIYEGDLTEGERLCRYGIGLLDSSHPKEIISFENNLGMILNAMSRHHEALQLLTKVEKQIETLYGSSCAESILQKINIAYTLERLKSFSEAKQLYIDANNLSQTHFGPSHHLQVIICMNLSMTCFELGDITSAYLWINNSLSISSTLYSENSSIILIGKLARAHYLAADKKIDEALVEYSTYLPMLRQSVGPENPQYKKAERRYLDLTQLINTTSSVGQ